jgi:hypothetical protein
MVDVEVNEIQVGSLNQIFRRAARLSEVYSVAERFLRRKATVGELRTAVKAVKGE